MIIINAFTGEVLEETEKKDEQEKVPPPESLEGYPEPQLQEIEPETEK